MVFEEAQELLVAMARPALGQDPAGGNVQGGEEGGGAVADVAVRDAFDVTQSEGQEGLGALQGLDLALLVNAQDHGMVGRIKVEADDVADLFDEEGVGGELGSASAGGAGGGRRSRRAGPWTSRPRWPRPWNGRSSACRRRGAGSRDVFRSSVMRVSSGMDRGRPGRCSS